MAEDETVGHALAMMSNRCPVNDRCTRGYHRLGPCTFVPVETGMADLADMNLRDIRKLVDGLIRENNDLRSTIRSLMDRGGNAHNTYRAAVEEMTRSRDRLQKQLDQAIEYGNTGVWRD